MAITQEYPVDIWLYPFGQHIDVKKSIEQDFGFHIQQITIGFPKPKTVYIDVPHSSSVLDFTQIYGMPNFGMRTIKVKMLYMGDWSSWHTAISALATYIQGTKLNIVVHPDDAFFYTGRCNSVPTHDSYYMAPVELTWDCLPFKFAVQGTSDPWLWDPFNFLTGIALDSGTYIVTGSTTVTLPGSPQPVTPLVTTTADFTITYNGTAYQTGIITSQPIPNFVIGTTEQTATLAGTGNITIDYRRASL